MTPTVTFIVPCYRLGHVLADCMHSILAQTYRDFELLVMDDDSPDATPDVARSFADDRVRYVRNDPNLGHLRNYNKGIGLARGKYVWLISADDCLRQPYVLERFVAVLDRHSRAGYVFCPAIRFDGAQDLYVYGSHGDRDAILEGRTFLKRLAAGNCVPAAAAMARRVCYERQALFPLDLPFAGDWYLWSVFALTSDVAYLGEPMVGWRLHAGNMTHGFKRRPAALMADEMNVRWRLLRMAGDARSDSVAAAFLQGIAFDYAERVLQKVGGDSRFGLSVLEFEQSLVQYGAVDRERAAIRAVVYAAVGDRYADAGALVRARECYRRAVNSGPAWRTMLKHALLYTGQPGVRAREAIVALRQLARRARRFDSANALERR